jgi:hypothetical protein
MGDTIALTLKIHRHESSVHLQLFDELHHQDIACWTVGFILGWRSSHTFRTYLQRIVPRWGDRSLP